MAISKCLLCFVVFLIAIGFQTMFGAIQEPVQDGNIRTNEPPKQLERPLSSDILTNGKWRYYSNVLNVVPPDGVPVVFRVDGRLSLGDCPLMFWRVNSDGELEVLDERNEVNKVLRYDKEKQVLINRHPLICEFIFPKGGILGLGTPLEDICRWKQDNQPK